MNGYGNGPNVRLTIKVKDDGKMEAWDPDGGSLQGTGGIPPPVITLPAGAQLLDACIVLKTNPTCAYVLMGGAWQRKCW